MNKIFLLFVILLSVAVAAKAQNVSIYVRDSLSKQAIEGATVLIIESPQSIKRGISNKQGIVILRSPGKTTYTMVKHLSYQEYRKGIDYSTVTDSLVLFLQPEITELSTVEITAVKQQVKQDAKGMVLDIGKMQLAKVWRLRDALEQMPGIKLEGGGISYLGQPVTVKENGFNSASARQNLTAILDEPATSFSTVRLLVNDPKNLNDGPSLNLNRAKREEDTWGSIYAGAGMVSQNAGAFLSQATGAHLMDLRASYDRQQPPDSKSETQTVMSASGQKTLGSGEGQMLMQNANAAGHYNYHLAKHTFDISGAYRLGDTKNTNNYSTNEYRQDTLYRSSITEKETGNRSNTIDLTTGYIWQPNAGSQLYATVQASYAPSDNPDQSRSLVTGGTPMSTLSYNKEKHTELASCYAMLSYETKHARLGDFEFGAKYFYRYRSEEVGYAPLGSTAISASYRNNYQYVALFGTWSKSFGKYSAYLVLKGDYSTDKVPTSNNAHYDYLAFSPYLSLFRPLPKGQSIRLTLGYSEKRPNLAALNPIVEPGYQGTGLRIVRGNPDLKPEQNFRLSLGYTCTFLKKIMFTSTLTNTYGKDIISGYDTVEADTILVRTFKNLAEENNTNLNLNMIYPIVKGKLNASCNASGSLNATRLDPTASVVWNTPWNLSGSLTYIPYKNWSVSASSSYNKSNSYQMETSGYWTNTAGIGYHLSNLDLSLVVFNPFRPNNTRETRIDAAGYTSISKTTSRQFDLSFSLNYRFGKEERKARKRAKGITVDDM